VNERRTQRLKLKEALSDRRSAASKQRMKLLAQMGTGSMDGFGRSDADWDVYRKVTKGDGPDSDSEEEKVEIERIEQLIKEYRPDDAGSDTADQAALHRIHINVERIRVR
jgi:hypothetical protein